MCSIYLLMKQVMTKTILIIQLLCSTHCVKLFAIIIVVYPFKSPMLFLLQFLVMKIRDQEV